MNLSDIAHLRLSNQQLANSIYQKPKEIVSWLGAMQAQDYNMSKSAIGVRLPNSTEDSIEQAINKGEILRTHVLRPTWHLVAPKDIRWMLELTGPRLLNMVASWGKKLELDSKTLNRTNSIIQKLLRDKNYSTREELMKAIQKVGISTDDLRSAHIMFHAELNGIVCSGPMREKKITYALLDERVPLTKKVRREEAVGMLAERYFKSHGPATIADFVWWSGLTMKDAREGLKMVESKLISETIDSQVYWLSSSGYNLKKNKNSIFFLPAFDEFMVSYKNRSASLDKIFTKNTITANGIFKPIIVINGKVEGIWKRTIKKDHVLIENQFFNSSFQLKENQLKQLQKELAFFFEKEIKWI